MTADVTPTRRRYAKSAVTRDRILDAARDLFAERGFRSVSLRDIAGAADLSHPGVQRHFRTTADILDAVVARLESDNERWLEETGRMDDGEAMLPALARHNAATPGYVELFTVLAGEATAIGHPAHARMRDRYADLRARSREGLDVDDGAAASLAAVSDGLQLISLYDPRIDVGGELEAYLGWRRTGATGSSTPVPPGSVDETGAQALARLVGDESGYATGRARRAALVEAATAHFAANGFHDASLREIADAAGMAKSTLLHHFSSKDELLAAVLVHRDRRVAELYGANPDASGVEQLRGAVEGARRNAGEPGLVEVYAVLSSEASSASHPAHDYFRRRFDAARAGFAAEFADARAAGATRADLDSARAALWTIALWDGLQWQWLYDRDAIDVPALLSRTIEGMLTTA
ncbi:TetR/AcrR family transcriptional regulator [Agromyces mangrovi Wang et al. 2018]|uniref:TetR/AcrR family transcriptional regulator n=1 Tax=Agromyces mangrovi TaxID=1858653 RepID=UPI0025744120|nr:TetR/AcrR family transcriptional regulator [Agromyces mangrovi]BDZ65624.1 hypothetical protein GCM10025877_25620 [Agromyces mangrovi]